MLQALDKLLTNRAPSRSAATYISFHLILQKLDKLYKEYTKKTRKLEDTLDLYEMKMARGKKLKKRKTVSCSHGLIPRLSEATCCWASSFQLGGVMQ